MVSICVNNSKKQVAKETTLATLMFKINPQATGLAVAVNNHVIPKKQWEETLLTENDNILIITATQGG